MIVIAAAAGILVCLIVALGFVIALRALAGNRLDRELRLGGQVDTGAWAQHRGVRSASPTSGRNPSAGLAA